MTLAQKTLRRFRDQHAGAISALRRVPNEILGEIMKYCIPVYDSINSKQPFRAALVLASVSTGWRDAAMSTPQLWTTIVWQTTSMKKNVRLTELILSRSGDCSFELHNLSAGAKDHWFLWQAIKPHIGRMNLLDGDKLTAKTLATGPALTRLRSLIFPTPMTTNDLLKLFQCCPGLEEAHVSIRDNQWYSYIDHDVDMPRLRRFTLKGHTDPVRLFTFLSTPRLSELDLAAARETTTWNRQDFIKLFSVLIRFLRNASSIRSLKIPLPLMEDQRYELLQQFLG